MHDKLDDIVVLLEVDHKADRLAVPAPAGKLACFQREELAVGREQHELVGGRRLDCPFQAVTLLEVELRQIVEVPLHGPDPALGGEHDGDGLLLDHRLVEVDLDGRCIRERRPAPAGIGLLAELLLRFLDLVGDAAPLQVVRFEQRLQLAPLLAQAVVLGLDLDFLELAQRPEAHVEDGFRLHVAELENPHQLGLRLILLADDADHLVEVQVGDEVAAQHLEPVLDVLDAMLGAADEHDLAVVEPLGQHVADREHVRHLPLREHVHIEGHAHLELGELEQAFHQHERIDGAALRLEHEADVLGGLVPDVAEQRHLLQLDQLGELLDELRLLHLVGDLGDDDKPGTVALVLLLPLGPQAEAAAAGLVGLDDLVLRLDDDAAGREIRPRHQLDELVDVGVRELDQVQDRVAQLFHVVRRDRGRHADGDAGRAVGEEVREAAREDDRLLVLAVERVAEIDRVLVDAVEQLDGDLGKPRLRVAVGGGVIAVDVAEVALAVDQRIAGGEVLREAHERVIDRLVAVGMVFADDVADDAGALLVRFRRVEPELAHGEQEPPVNGLQAVAHVGQRAAHDGRQRISKIALLQRVADVDLFDGA